MILRGYQTRAVEAVRDHWASGERNVCLVAPTGAGKTVMGAALVGDTPAVWLTHRLELIDQTRARLPRSCEVVGVQALMASGERPSAEILVIDECHHYAADEWGEIAKAIGSDSMRVVGLTATPERSDGRPLGDMFGALVVAAQYSELLEHDPPALVDCKVFRAPELLPSGELANNPLEMYRELAAGRQGFLFTDRVTKAHAWAATFTDAGFDSAPIDGKTPKDLRREILASFTDGQLRMLTNVYALTEGVDVPAASVCILARRASHQSIYLQMVGRVLRPAPGKSDAILLDLTGVSHLHGLPTADREYSLHGTAIRTKGAATRDCPACGVVLAATALRCPECGHVLPAPKPEEPAKPKIWSMALEAVYDGIDTPAHAREAEWLRLSRLCADRGWKIGWAVREFQKLFPKLPAPATGHQRLAYLRNVLGTARERGYKQGWALYRYKAAFGQWPDRALIHEAEGWR